MKAQENLPLGKHLVVEMWVETPRLLDAPEHVRTSLLAAARRGNFTVINVNVHAFSPHGVTGVALLAESHMSIHTWPEFAYAALDVFACSGDPWGAVDELKERLHVERVQVRELDRGVVGEIPCGPPGPDRSHEAGA